MCDHEPRGGFTSMRASRRRRGWHHQRGKETHRPVYTKDTHANTNTQERCCSRLPSVISRKSTTNVFWALQGHMSPFTISRNNRYYDNTRETRLDAQECNGWQTHWGDIRLKHWILSRMQYYVPLGSLASTPFQSVLPASAHIQH